MNCNLCGKPFDMWDRQENFGFDYHVGYGSKYDLQHITVHFCCSCFDKLLDELIPRFKIPMESHELSLSAYGVWDPEDIPDFIKSSFHPGDRVIMNDRYHVSAENRGRVWTVISEPWNLCDTWVIALDGLHGCYAVDGLTKVSEAKDGTV